MALSFPTGPTLNDQYTAGGNTWYWDGTKWRTFGSVLGPIGPAGVTGGSTNDLPKITAVTYTDASFVASANTSLLSDTAGYVKLTGSNFSSFSTVYVNNTKATTTYVSSTQLNVVLPAASTGTYNIYLYNTNNGGCTVKAAGVAYASAKAYGGIISNSGSYSVHAFTSSGIFTTTQTLTVDYLIVAGGGSSGLGSRGIPGGGAGGVRSFTSQTLSAGTYTIVVGGGGVVSYGSGGVKGNNSSGFGYTAAGGGNGASSYTLLVAGSGGSGGGGVEGSGTPGNPGTGTNAGGAGNTPSTSPVQGYAGGISTVSTNCGAGGGGAGGVGGNVTVDGTAGNGGPGVYISQFDMYGTDASNAASGSSGRGYYGGGGGGYYYYSYINGLGNGTAGVGGGATIYGGTAVSAKINTGGGGAYVNSTSSGASGIVLIRYLT